MAKKLGPLVLLLDSDYSHSLSIAYELKKDLGCRINAVRTSNLLLNPIELYVDKTLYLSRDDVYEKRLLEYISTIKPDFVFPVGFKSFEWLDSVRGELPHQSKVFLPRSEALKVALDKGSLLSRARIQGMRVPEEFSDRVGDFGFITSKLPVFLKASHEAGKNITSFVTRFEDLQVAIDRLKIESNNDKILVQEYIDGDEHTYSCGMIYENGELLMSYQHDEIKSVPRKGGSATRIRIMNDPVLQSLSESIMGSLNWNGIALVEFKRNREGEYVLMEVNPKFWASYALASRYGYHFASFIVAKALGLQFDADTTKAKIKGSMIFPVRELMYSLKNESKREALKHFLELLLPPAKIDYRVRELLGFSKNLLKELIKEHRRKT